MARTFTSDDQWGVSDPPAPEPPAHPYGYDPSKGPTSLRPRSSPTLAFEAVRPESPKAAAPVRVDRPAGTPPEGVDPLSRRSERPHNIGSTERESTEGPEVTIEPARQSEPSVDEPAPTPATSSASAADDEPAIRMAPALRDDPVASRTITFDSVPGARRKDSSALWQGVVMGAAISTLGWIVLDLVLHGG
jgi:hypothetical protein